MDRAKLNRTRVAAAVAVVFGAAAGLVFLARALFPPAAPVPAAAVGPVVAPPPPEPALVEEKILVTPRSTLAELLKRRGFTDREIHDLREAVKPVYDLGKIRAGQEIRLASLADGPLAEARVRRRRDAVPRRQPESGKGSKRR